MERAYLHMRARDERAQPSAAKVVSDHGSRYLRRVTLRARIASVVLSSWCVLGAAERAAFAEDELAARCIAAAERAQVLRDDGHLVESRAEFAACGAEGCPAIVRRDCLRWLTDADERAPSIIVSVKTQAGRDVIGASVLLDGVLLPRTSLGRAVPVDPGPHQVRAVHPDYPAAEQRVVVREREKGRVLELVLTKPPAVSSDDGAVSTHRDVPWLTFTLGGVSVLGGAGFAALWASGMDRVSDLRASCAPHCSQARIDDLRPTFLAARVSLAVGIGAAVGAVLAYLLRPAPATHASRRASGPSAGAER
jgi:hypothetical protein